MPFLALKKYSAIAAILIPALHSFLYGTGPAIVGGQFDNPFGVYANLVRSNGELVDVFGGNFSFLAGELTSLSDTDLPSDGVITSVAINDSGWGIIARQDNTNANYAAVVSPDGNLTSLSGDNFPSNTSQLKSVAMNNSRWGIIGGSDSGFAALVTPNNDLIELFEGGVASSLNIFSVAINNSNIAIIGGKDPTGTAPPYAAFVAQDGTLSRIAGTAFPF
ncbi:MAG: hypothetical protein AAF443_08340 [Chlamydiota bacterium]